MQERYKLNVLKMIETLKANGPMHARGLARLAGMHPATVFSIASRLGRFFDMQKTEIFPKIELTIISLKSPDVKLEDIERYLEVKKRIRGTP